MKKKWLAVLLCGCLIFTGCGSSDDGEETSGGDGNKGESGSLISGNKNNSTNGQEDPGSATKAPDSSETDKDGEDAQTGAYWHPQGSVVLGQYVGISVDKVVPEVKDEDVQSEIDYLLDQSSEPKVIEDRNVV